jgi:hypothetical protein
LAAAAPSLLPRLPFPSVIRLSGGGRDLVLVAE